MSFLVRQLSGRQASSSSIGTAPKAPDTAAPGSPAKAAAAADNEAEKKDEDLIHYTQTIAAKVHQQAAEIRDKLTAIQGGEAILEKMLEVINEVDAHHKRIAATLTTPSVYVALKGLCESIGDCSKFLEELDRRRFLITGKSRLRREMLFQQQAVRNRCTQLMTAVSLALADRPSLFPLTMSDDELDQTYIRAIKAYYGIECPRNIQLASRLCTSAAEHGHTPSMLLLSQLLEEGLGVEIDVAKARQWLELAASKQHPDAQNKLALKLIQEAREADPTAAADAVVAKCLKFASCSSPVTEDSKMLDNMSVDLASMSVDDKVARALQLLLSAAELGNAEAQTNLASLHEEAEDYEEAASLYKVAMGGGCVRAENCLGMLYQAGNGVPKDEKMAFTMFMSAARKGNGHACYNAGFCLEHGVGAPKDLVTALNLYQDGVKHGNAMCAYSLGYLYCKLAATENADQKETYKQAQQGILLLQRYVHRSDQVFVWLLVCALTLVAIFVRSASEQGIADASYHLANIYDHGRLTIRSRASALTCYEVAARQGHGRAAHRAGDLWYSSGTHQCIDHFQRAVEFYEMAVKLAAIPEAANALGIMREEGKGCQRDYRIAYSMYELAARQVNRALLVRTVVQTWAVLTRFACSRSYRRACSTWGCCC
jgi:TPR repeat protein